MAGCATGDEEFEAFLDKGHHEVTEAELWQWTSRLLEEVAREWGRPPTERSMASRDILVMLVGLSPGDIVLAVLSIRRDGGVR